MKKLLHGERQCDFSMISMPHNYIIPCKKKLYYSIYEKVNNLSHKTLIRSHDSDHITISPKL